MHIICIAFIVKDINPSRSKLWGILTTPRLAQKFLLLIQSLPRPSPQLWRGVRGEVMIKIFFFATICGEMPSFVFAIELT